MSDFSEQLAERLHEDAMDEKTLTENGAVALATTGSALLDFHYDTASFRAAPEADIERAFARAYDEDRRLAVLALFHAGDVRGGLGERRLFRTAFRWLARRDAALAERVLSLVPEFTRWDAVSNLAVDPTSPIRDAALRLVAERLRADEAALSDPAASVSLCAKWLPSENASSAATRAAARRLARALGMDARRYRRTLSALRERARVVERDVSARAWDRIDYSAVPSQANLRYRAAFLRHDEIRRRAFLERVRTGETKINAAVADPHEIVARYRRIGVDETDDSLEALWKALPRPTLGDALVMRDGSVSMTGPFVSCGATPLDIATALAIYVAESNAGVWHDKFLTFSSEPALIDLSGCGTLRDKIERCDREDDCSNTDIAAAMRLVLRTAVENHVSPDAMPKMILILSDMQFDPIGNDADDTAFETLAREFRAAGYDLPRICFWNLMTRPHERTVPMRENENGVVLCSSFSKNTLKMFLSGSLDPLAAYVEVLESERYKPVDRAMKTS